MYSLSTGQDKEQVGKQSQFRFAPQQIHFDRNWLPCRRCRWGTKRFYAICRSIFTLFILEERRKEGRQKRESETNWVLVEIRQSRTRFNQTHFRPKDDGGIDGGNGVRCKENAVRKTYESTGNNTLFFFLQVLTSVKIKSGYEVLKELEDAIKNKESPSVLEKLTSRFYTLIPHSFGNPLCSIKWINL